MRYLICGGPGIGDFVFILPMIRMIHMNDSEAVIDLFTRSTKSRIKITEKLATLTTGIHKISYYAIDEPFHTIKFALGLLANKKYDYGFVISYSNTPYSSIWPYVITRMSCRKIIGTNLEYKPIAKYDIAIPNIKQTQPRKNIMDYQKFILQAIGYDTSLDFESENFLNTATLENLLPPFEFTTDAPLVLLLIGAASYDQKNWSFEQWDKLIDLLLERKISVMIIGGKDEAEELQKHPEITNKKEIINMAGKCNILQSLALLSKSNLIIGADTGLVHLAWAINVPSLTLFGPTDPRSFFIPGRGAEYIASDNECRFCFDLPEPKWRTCKDNICMKSISVEKVFNKAIDMLNKFCPEKMRV